MILMVNQRLLKKLRLVILLMVVPHSATRYLFLHIFGLWLRLIRCANLLNGNIEVSLLLRCVFSQILARGLPPDRQLVCLNEPRNFQCLLPIEMLHALLHAFLRILTCFGRDRPTTSQA